MNAILSLVVRRHIRATPDRLFRAWTTPSELLCWWGPRGVRCTHAELDLQVGGRYRIVNLMGTGETINIVGQFLSVSPPHELVYDWAIEFGSAPPEQVTVRFKPVQDGTEVIVIHEQIGDRPLRDQHQAGWLGCLDGLEAHSLRS